MVNNTATCAITRDLNGAKYGCNQRASGGNVTLSAPSNSTGSGPYVLSQDSPSGIWTFSGASGDAGSVSFSLGGSAGRFM